MGHVRSRATTAPAPRPGSVVGGSTTAELGSDAGVSPTSGIVSPTSEKETSSWSRSQVSTLLVLQSGRPGGVRGGATTKVVRALVAGPPRLWGEMKKRATADSCAAQTLMLCHRLFQRLCDDHPAAVLNMVLG